MSRKGVDESKLLLNSQETKKGFSFHAEPLGEITIQFLKIQVKRKLYFQVHFVKMNWFMHSWSDTWALIDNVLGSK